MSLLCRLLFLNLFVSGWPAIFYTGAAVSCLVTFLFLIFYTNDPSENGFISTAEKEYIIRKRIGNLKSKPSAIPWRGIIASIPFYSCIVSSICHTFVTQLLRRFTPLYFEQIAGLSYIGNAVYSSLQYLVQLVTRIGAGSLSDRKVFEAFLGSKTRVLKVINTLCFAIVTGALLALTFITKETPKAVPIFLMILSMGALTICSGGWQKCPLLIAPQHSGTLGSLIMFSGDISSITMPYVFSAVVPRGTYGEWQRMFIIGVALCVVALVEFLFLGSGEIQTWAHQSGTIAPEDTNPASAPIVIVEKF